MAQAPEPTSSNMNLITADMNDTVDSLDTRELDFGDEEEVDFDHTGKEGIFISYGGILQECASVYFLAVVPQIKLLYVLAKALNAKKCEKPLSNQQ